MERLGIIGLRNVCSPNSKVPLMVYASSWYGSWLSLVFKAKLPNCDCLKLLMKSEGYILLQQFIWICSPLLDIVNKSVKTYWSISRLFHIVFSTELWIFIGSDPSPLVLGYIKHSVYQVVTNKNIQGYCACKMLLVFVQIIANWFKKKFLSLHHNKFGQAGFCTFIIF